MTSTEVALPPVAPAICPRRGVACDCATVLGRKPVREPTPPVAAPSAAPRGGVRSPAAAAPKALAATAAWPALLKGVIVPAALVSTGADGGRLFKRVDDNLVKLGSIFFFTAKIEALLATLGFAPGTYVLSSLLIADTNPSKAKLLRYAVTDAAGGQDIIVPDDKWFSEKWVIKHDLYCTKTSVMTDRIRAFFQ